MHLALDNENEPAWVEVKNLKDVVGGVSPTSQVTHCNDKIPKFRNKYSQKRKYQGLSPNFHIHASVSDLYIPTIGLPILLEEICRPIQGLYKSLTDT
jgi:hypothetical protein